MSVPALAGPSARQGAAGAFSPGLADGLSFAAAPVFAGMALLTWMHGGGTSLCSTASSMTLLASMPAMYALMSAVHSGPWIRLVSRPISTARDGGGPTR